MKHWIATLFVAIGLSLGPSAMAGSVDKEPLNFNEITELAAEDQIDRQLLEDTEAGLKSGSGLVILAIIGVIILVAN